MQGKNVANKGRNHVVMNISAGSWFLGHSVGHLTSKGWRYHVAEHLVPLPDGIGRDFDHQRDNAPIYKAQRIREWLEQGAIFVIVLLGTSPNLRYRRARLGLTKPFHG